MQNATPISCSSGEKSLSIQITREETANHAPFYTIIGRLKEARNRLRRDNDSTVLLWMPLNELYYRSTDHPILSSFAVQL